MRCKGAVDVHYPCQVPRRIVERVPGRGLGLLLLLLAQRTPEFDLIDQVLHCLWCWLLLVRSGQVVLEGKLVEEDGVPPEREGVEVLDG